MARRDWWTIRLCGALAAACASSAAYADVLEIAPDGEVTTYAGPMTYTDEGARAIVAPAEPPAPRRAPTSGSVLSALAAAAERHGVDQGLLEAVAWQESRFNHAAVSPKGAIGVMQLMPGTARELGVDPSKLDQNTSAGAAYLAGLLRRYKGDVKLGLAAYNAGPGAVDRYGGVPPYAETRRYVDAILGRLAQRPR